MTPLKAPFIYFGGKSKVAELVWSRLGDVPNYVEPFFGSGAVLLARPSAPRIETVNDINGHLCNFWRSIKLAPKETAQWATWPVSECDLIARHSLLRATDLTDALKLDENFYDAKMAGYWVWGINCWIGSGWCESEAKQLPYLGNAERGVTKKLPHLGNAERGVTKKLPHLGNAERGLLPASPGLLEWFGSLSDRLRTVQIAHGDWSRVTSPAVTYRHGLTGVFLDPPYGDGCNVYSSDMKHVAKEAAEWAISQGDNPLMRIAFCGYEGTVEFPSSWDCVEWKANGGFAAPGGKAEKNAKRERIWFSPHCVQDGLF